MNKSLIILLCLLLLSFGIGAQKPVPFSFLNGIKKSLAVKYDASQLEALGSAVIDFYAEDFSAAQKQLKQVCLQSDLCINLEITSEVVKELQQVKQELASKCVVQDKGVACAILAALNLKQRKMREAGIYLFYTCVYSNAEFCYKLAVQSCRFKASQSALVAFKQAIKHDFNDWQRVEKDEELQCLRQQEGYGVLQKLYSFKMQANIINEMPASVLKESLEFARIVGKGQRLKSKLCLNSGEHFCLAIQNAFDEEKQDCQKNVKACLATGLVNMRDNKWVQGTDDLVKSCRASNMVACYLLSSLYSRIEYRARAEAYFKQAYQAGLKDCADWEKTIKRDNLMRELRTGESYKKLEKEVCSSR